MTTFIEKVRPLLFSEDDVLRNAWLFQLHDYPEVPVELVNELLIYCQTHESARIDVLMNLENSPKNEESIELLLQWAKELPLKDKHHVFHFLQSVEPKTILKYKADLLNFMGRDYINYCKKIVQYERPLDGDFEPLWELYGEKSNVVEIDPHPQHLALLKHIIQALIRVGEYDAEEARFVIADEMQEENINSNGWMAIYAAGVMQLEDLIPQFVELMKRDEDDLIPILLEAMIRLQSEQVVQAVAPYILERKNGVFTSASMILKEAKTQAAEKILLDAYNRTSDIEMKEYLLDALISHLSPQAFALIDDFLEENKTAMVFDMEELFYSYYKAMSKDHPLLETWRESVVERDEQITQEINEIITKDLMREEFGKVGRNDPCICGSGKKFKKCCGK